MRGSVALVGRSGGKVMVRSGHGSVPGRWSSSGTCHSKEPCRSPLRRRRVRRTLALVARPDAGVRRARRCPRRRSPPRRRHGPPSGRHPVPVPARRDRPRRHRHVLRPRLRPRRRHVPVRRAGPCPRRPGRRDDPRPLLRGDDARAAARPAGSASSCCRRSRRPPRSRSSSTAGPPPGPSTASPGRSRPTRSSA